MLSVVLLSALIPAAVGIAEFVRKVLSSCSTGAEECPDAQCKCDVLQAQQDSPSSAKTLLIDDIVDSILLECELATTDNADDSDTEECTVAYVSELGDANQRYKQVAMEGIELLNDLMDCVRDANLIDCVYENDVKDITTKMQQHPHTVTFYIDYMNELIRILCYHQVPNTKFLDARNTSLTFNVLEMCAVDEYHSVVRDLIWLLMVCEDFGLDEEYVIGTTSDLQEDRKLVMATPALLPNKLLLIKSVMEVITSYRMKFQESKYWNALKDLLEAHESLVERVGALHMRN